MQMSWSANVRATRVGLPLLFASNSAHSLLHSSTKYDEYHSSLAPKGVLNSGAPGRHS
jgi:hypothetical protein